MRSAIPFGVRRVLAALLFVAPIVLSQLAAAPAAAAGSDAREPDYLTSPDLRSRALDAIFNEIGNIPKVSKVRISRDAVDLLVQAPTRPHYTDAWRAERFRFLFIDRDAVSGPSPSQGDGIVAETEKSFFDLADVAVTDFDAVVGRAIEKAALEDPPDVTGVEISRSIQILPERTYGDVRWTITLSSGRETATVYANAAGSITSADLSQTIRARRLDLIAQDDWPADQAAADLLNVIGDGVSLHELRVYNSYIFIEADHPSRPDVKRDYSWNYSGVKRGLVDTPTIPLAVRTVEKFALSDVDLQALPQVKAAAIEAFDFEGSRITYIKAEKSRLEPGNPRVLWYVDLQQPDGAKGRVTIDIQGKVVNTRLPESRLPDAPWLDPETVASTLGRIVETFGANARYDEIMIDDNKATIKVEEPSDPGKLSEFILNRSGINRFPSLGPLERQPNPARVFTAADFTRLDPEALATFSRKAMADIAIDGGEVFRFTISRGTISAAPDGRLLIEVRVGKNDGWTSGWVLYDLEGRRIDMAGP